MKKKLITYALLASLAFGISACGSNSSSSDDAQSEEAAVEEVAEETEEEMLDEAEGEKFASMEEVLEIPEVHAELEEVFGDLGDGMTGEVRGEGAKLIYSIKVLDMNGADTKTMSDAMAQAFEPQKDYYVGLATSLKEAVDVPTPIVVVEVLDPDGVVLFKESYPAE